MTAARGPVPVHLGTAAVAAVVALAAVALVVPGHLAGESFAQSVDVPECPSAAAGDECVYHVTEALAIRDIRPAEIRADPDTGYVYVATNPIQGSRDMNYSYLSAYNSSANGYLPIAEFKFDIGYNTRIAGFEINNRTNELHVVHLWGLADPSEGWSGREWDRQGKVNLTTIDLDTHEISKTIRLYYNETTPLPSYGGAVWSSERFWIHGIALDRERDLAYIGAERAPILVVDTSTTTLLPAVVNRTGTNSGADGWNAYAVGTISMHLTVDEDSGMVYAGVVVGDKLDERHGSWGIAALNFTGADGSATAYYERVGFHNVSSQRYASTSDYPNCGNPPQPRPGFYHFTCNDGAADARIEALRLDSGNGKLFALYQNHTVWAVTLEDGIPSGMEEVHIRTPEETGRSADRTIEDIALDSQRGLLYASLYDWTDPRVIVLDSATHARVGVASTTSQTWDMGVDSATGAVYVLPQWALGAYVIEGEPKADLQRRIDAASDGDTITVEPGIYDDTVLDIYKPLTLTTASGQPGAAKFTGYSRIEIEADDVTVRGLSFENTDCMPGFGGSLVEIRTHGGVARERVTIENNVFRDTCHAAIQKEGNGKVIDIAIRDNTFVNIGLKVPPGWTEPLDTGGENEFQIMHGAIGLSHHPGQNTVSGEISGNFINGTSAAGIRVFNADSMVISNNYIANTPASAIGLPHGPSDVQVTGNTIVNANSEPDLDYLAGIEGSGDADYWRFIGGVDLPGLDLTPTPQDDPALVPQNLALDGTGKPSPDAAINVWANGQNVQVTGNTIRGSDGAFTACTGVCAFESDGLVRGTHPKLWDKDPTNSTERRVLTRNIPPNSTDIGGQIAFTDNIVYAHSGPDNNGALITSHASGTLDASGNHFPGYSDASDIPTAGRVDLGTPTLAEMSAPDGEAAQCPSSADADRCTYHATGSFTAGDISPATVRIDHERGIAYVASKINAGASNPEEVVLLAYEIDADRGYPLVKAFDPVGTHYPRVPAMEIDVENRALYVIHSYNHSYRIGEAYLGSHDANAHLAKIDLDTMEIEWTTPMLNHTNRLGETNTRYDLFDIALDPANEAAFIMTEGYRPDNENDRNASPVLVVSTNNGTVHPAVFHDERHPYTYTQDPDAVLAVANPSAMAANLTDSHTAYVVGRIGTFADPHWGIATVSFEGPTGEVHPDYEVHDFVTLIDNPASHNNYHTYRTAHESYNSVLARDVILDDKNDLLYVLMRNKTLYKYDLGIDTKEIGGDTIGLPRSQEKVAGLPSGPWDGTTGIDFDAKNGMLYAVSTDYARPSVYAINASNAAIVGESSLNDEMIALSVDQGNGTVYASPSWTPSVYVIDPLPRNGIQNLIDAAAEGSVVTIPDGTYDDTVLVIEKSLTLTSSTGEAGPARFTGHSRIQVESDNVAIRGLSFEDTDCMPGMSYNHIGIHNKAARSGITIENNRFADTCHAAVQTKGANTLEDVKVRFNELVNVGTKIAPGKTEPLNTGGEDEWLYTHGGIGLSYHPGQNEVRNADISYNDIRGTSSAGIRVFNPDDVRIVGNTIHDTPEAGIALAHNKNYDASDVLIRANALINTNSEPDMDYLDGVEGSGELSYYTAVGILGRASLTGLGQSPHYEKPTPSAAIKVWANLEGVTVTDNAIRGSGGAFVACAGTCATESDGVIHSGPDNNDRKKVRNILLPDYDGDPPDPRPNNWRNPFASYSINVTANNFAFNWNAISGDNDRNGADLIANNATGVLDATNNYYPGMIAPGQIRSPDTVNYSTTARAIASVSPAPSPGVPGIDDALEIAVAFNKDTVVNTLYGKPSLLLSTGPETGTGTAEYRGASADTLNFEYMVREGDLLGSDILVRMDLNGAVIDAEPNPDAVLELPAISSVPMIDSVRPYVLNVTTTTPAGSYYPGSAIEIIASFSEDVVVAGAPSLPLATDLPGSAALYSAGNGTSRIAFEYTVRGGDTADPLTNAAADLILAGGASIRDMAGNDAALGLPGAGTGASLAETSDGQIAILDRDLAETAATAVFSARNAIRIDYTASLGPPTGYTGDVYGTIELSDGTTASPTDVAGLGTATHTVRFGGPGVSRSDTGTIALNTDLAGRSAGGTPQTFTDDTIPVRAGTFAVTVAPTGSTPVVTIERDGFVRQVDVVDGGDAVRPAVNVSSLAEMPLEENGTNTVRLPGTDTVAIVASFAEVHFPPNVTATMVPADGLLELYVSPDRPTVQEVAEALGDAAPGAGAASLEVLQVIEVGDSEARIVFDLPVRIVLDGQAGGSAFYVNTSDGAIVPIAVVCEADDTAAVHAQLGGSGECQRDSGGDKVIHTYHLTKFGTARAASALEDMVSMAPPGGTVKVQPGEYRAAVLIVDKPLTIEAADPDDRPVFTGYSHIVVEPAAGGPITVRNLAFMNTTHTSGAGGLASITVLSRAGSVAAAPVTIEGNTFRDTCDSGIRAATDAGAPPIADLTIAGNRFYDIGSNSAGCMSPSAPDRADAIVAGRHGQFTAGMTQLANATIRDNYIFGTTYTGMRVAGADGLVVEGNHIEGVPDDGIRILPSRNVDVRGNTILGANGAPHAPAGGVLHDGAAGAAIEVWSGSDDVAVSLNRISGSAGALAVCAGMCDPGADAADGTGGDPVPVGRAPLGSSDGANDMRFSHNTIDATNTAPLVANSAGGMLAARSNYYPGHAASVAAGAGIAAAPGASVAYLPAIDDDGPVRVGVVVADAPESPVRSIDAAVAAGFAAGAAAYNEGQARMGGLVGIEPVPYTVASPDAADSAAHTEALEALRTGANGDDRMRPVLENSIARAIALYDGNATGGLAAISAMEAGYGHYPFATARDGTLVAHGANASLVGRSDVVIGIAGGADGLRALYDFGDGSAATGIEGYPNASWKWWSYEFANPAAGGEMQSKRSIIVLHAGPDGEAGTADDLVFGAGYYPPGAPSHLLVAAGDAPAAADLTGGSGVVVSPTSTANVPALAAAADSLFRLAPPDGTAAGVLAGLLGADTIRVVVLNDSASAQSMSMAAALASPSSDASAGGRTVQVVSYDSASEGGSWAAAAMEAVNAAVGSGGAQANSTAVVYTGRAGAFADLAATEAAGSADASARWYATGELARAELGMPPPGLARATGLKVVSQYAAPSDTVDARLTAAMPGIVPDDSTRGPAYAAYDAAFLLGRSIAAAGSDSPRDAAPADVAAKMSDVARKYDGSALGGRLVLDANGDLAMPARYAVSAVGADGSWSRIGEPREGAGTCSIGLEKASADFGPLMPGQRSRADAQTVVNSGTMAYGDGGVAVAAGMWEYADGSQAALDRGLTMYRMAQGGAEYAALGASTMLPGSSLEPGGEISVQFVVDLASMPALAAGTISQTIAYSVSCR